MGIVRGNDQKKVAEKFKVDKKGKYPGVIYGSTAEEITKTQKGYGTLQFYLGKTKNVSQATRLHKLGEQYGHSKVVKAMGSVNSLNRITPSMFEMKHNKK